MDKLRNKNQIAMGKLSENKSLSAVAFSEEKGQEKWEMLKVNRENWFKWKFSTVAESNV